LDNYKFDLTTKEMERIEKKIDELTKSQNEIHSKQDILIETLNNPLTGHSVRIHNLEKDKSFYLKVGTFLGIIFGTVFAFYSKITDFFKG